MMIKEPDWGSSSFFFIPNEDTSIICEAISCPDTPPINPVFVGGSGMALLETMNTLPDKSNVTYVDISSNQVDYFRFLLSGLEKCYSAIDFQHWFVNTIYPKLRDHFIKFKNQVYNLDQVLSALENLFRTSFLFCDSLYQKVKATINRIKICRSDIISHLNKNEQYDFVYLSNVADYIKPEYYNRIFNDCANNYASIYLLLTDACNQRKLLKKTWEKVGYKIHKNSQVLSKKNRGLGSLDLKKSWNRKGEIYLLCL